MALPPCDQRYLYLRYEGLQYTDADIADFETRLARIYRREVHKVQVFDFGGLPDLMAEGLSTRMLMDHRDAQGQIGESARQIPDKGDLRDYWIGISSAGDFLGTALSYTSIRDMILRLCYRLIACNITGRSQTPEKVTVTDLFYLRGMDVGSVNFLYLLDRYLRLFSLGRKQGAMISGWQFVARLANHFGLLTEERLQGLTVFAPALPVIDMAKLPDAAAGAPGSDEDAPIVDEGDQAVPAPIHGALVEQREVIGAMARDFSIFTVWAASGITQLLDSARVTYTPYYETHIPYQRGVRCRTDGASTSATQQDQQQPDP
ncbi:hypothetical protein Tco_1005800 [Tanacetum coccineum]|uniref:Uncharacterized protein n=1 Tax=Tanacetum coccineum TaxID=301880 RepID=A0ABQ5FG73_9ASTR